MASWEDFSRILAEAKESKKLDPVGQEDDDVNNDGKVDDTDSYLKKRRASVGAAISADRKKKSMVKISVPEKKLGYKVADIGPDGKEHNVKTHCNYKEALDPVGQEDDDIDNDGKKNTKSDKYLLNRRKVRSKVIEGASTKVDMGGPKVGCDDPDPRSMKTASNLVKTKLRLMGLRPLVMSNEPEGEHISEISLPGTGTVMAPKTNTATGVTSPMMQRKFLGVNIGSPETVKTTRPSKFGPIPEYTPQQAKRYNAQPNRPSTISTNRDGFQQSIAKPSAKPAPTATAKPAAKPQGSPSDRAVQGLRSAASSGQMGGTLQTLSNRRAAIDTALQKNSYQPEGEIVEGKKKGDSYLETDMKKRRENNEKAVEDMKKTKGYSDMVKSARKAMGVDEEFVGEDKEYRREMAKAAARERAEEKRSDNEWRKTKPGEKKSLKLSTTPITDRTAKSYVDKELGQIKYMDKVTKKNKNVVGLVTKEENEIEEGISMKDFKANRKKNERKETSVDAEKRGHVGKEWYNTGRKYSPDEAKSRRSNMSDDDRRNRYGSSEDPDSEDYSTYPASKTKNPKKQRKQTAMGEEKGMSSDEMSGILKGHKYSKLQLLDMSKKSTKEGRHGEAAAFYKEFDRDDKKEELSLVDVMIAQFSPLNEAPENTIPGGKRRRGLSKTIQSRQVDKLADEGDYERADKLQDVSSVKLKKNKPQPPASKSPEPEPEKKQESGSKKETAGKSTATERAARTTAASRIRAARITRETEKEKREYKEKIRQEKKSEQQAGSEDRRKSAEEKQQKLKEIEKEKRADSAERAAQSEYDKKEAKKERLRRQIGAATQIKGPDVVSSKESDAKAIGSVTQGAAQLAAVPFKLAGVALKNANLRRKEKQREEIGKKAREKSSKDDSQNESFVNWREEFILEVDDQVVNPDQKKIIDVSKKKNKIEINPKIDEAAPLIPIIAKLAGGMTSKAVGSKLAGTAAKGTLRSKAAEFAANKAGNFASNTVQDKLGSDDESRKGGDIKDKITSGAEGLLSFLMPRSKVNEAAAWTKKSGKLQAAD